MKSQYKHILDILIQSDTNRFDELIYSLKMPILNHFVAHTQKKEKVCRVKNLEIRNNSFLLKPDHKVILRFYAFQHKSESICLWKVDNSILL